MQKSRNLRIALIRGWKLKCPACGVGSLMERFLKVRRSCLKCNQNLYHHKADDGPAWATILVTGHILAPSMLIFFQTFRPTGWIMASGFSIIFVVLALYLLPRFKGVFVSYQWAKFLFGFATEN